MLIIKILTKWTVVLHGTATEANGYLNDEGMPQWNIWRFNEINWFGGDQMHYDMFYDLFNDGVGNIMNHILIPNNETVLMSLEGYDEVDLKFNSIIGNKVAVEFSIYDNYAQDISGKSSINDSGSKGR